ASGRGLRPNRQGARADAVVTDVVERAAAELGPATDVLRALHGEREGAADEPELADRAAAQPLEHVPPLRVEAVHERLHPHDARGDTVLDRVLGLGAGAPPALLTP